MKKNKKNLKAAPKSNKNIILGVVAVAVVAVAIFTTLLAKDKKENAGKPPALSTVSTINENGDLVIPIEGITKTASFHAYNELENKMEIITVKASDGSIRTAFNTCQVCYASGRGYYVQQGDVLVCQNCRNRFNMNQVQVTRGGCNPVPIDGDDKIVTDTNITITKDFLKQAEIIFENWKM